jgi:hypothetical protein
VMRRKSKVCKSLEYSNTHRPAVNKINQNLEFA